LVVVVQIFDDRQLVRMHSRTLLEAGASQAFWSREGTHPTASCCDRAPFLKMQPPLDIRLQSLTTVRCRPRQNSLSQSRPPTSSSGAYSRVYVRRPYSLLCDSAHRRHPPERHRAVPTLATIRTPPSTARHLVVQAEN
jgi:hypothetical protein